MVRLPVGHSPWGPEWRCYLTSPSPWWFLPVVGPLERFADWLEAHAFDRPHDVVWSVRTWAWHRAAAWREKRRCSALWWEYHAS